METGATGGGSGSGGESGTASGAESVESNNETTIETTIFSTLWFIGIELKPSNNEALELNITDVILGFKDLSK